MAIQTEFQSQNRVERSRVKSLEGLGFNPFIVGLNTVSIAVPGTV